jgi:GT2 family glycosyltransferase
LFLPTSTLIAGLLPPKSLVGVQGCSWLNEEFCLYFEQLDIAERLAPGLKIAWCRNALIRHTDGSGSRQGHRSTSGEYHSTLSALKFTRLYHPGRLWFMAPARLIAKRFVNLSTWRPDLLGAQFRAYRDFCNWQNNSK